MVLASRRRAEAEADANSLMSRREPSSASFTERTSARSKLISSPPSVEMTSACVRTVGLFGSGWESRRSTVRIEPTAVRFCLVVTTTRAPCNCVRIEASPPPSVSAPTEKGMSAMRAEGGALEL
ncbi:MAG: hypothetical protein LC774_06865 [Acidobacteria bacterium]|nr:hypothetical protein [Acidobacteriota bacterium]